MSIKENIHKEALRIEEDTNFSSESHFITAHRWSKWHYWLGGPTAVFAILSGSSALAPFDNHNIFAGIFALITAVFAAVSTFLNPNETASSHLTAGNSYRSLRNETRIFSEIEFLRSPEEDLVKGIKELAERRDALNDSSPQPPCWAYEQAKKRIEVKQETKHRVDK